MKTQHSSNVKSIKSIKSRKKHPISYIIIYDQEMRPEGVVPLGFAALGRFPSAQGVHPSQRRHALGLPSPRLPSPPPSPGLFFVFFCSTGLTRMSGPAYPPMSPRMPSVTRRPSKVGESRAFALEYR